MATWPLYLPQHLRIDGQSGGPKDPFIRTEMSTGPAKQRRRCTKKVEPFDGSLLMSSDEYELFVEFWDNDLQGGALSFTWEHPITRAVATIRFTAPYKWEPQGASQFIISLSCEVV